MCVDRSHGSQLAARLPGKQLYRVTDAMAVLSMSRSVIYEQIRSGRLRSVTQGRTRLISASAIADYLALLERESEVA
jgi:excisionase family DNA binding protein